MYVVCYNPFPETVRLKVYSDFLFTIYILQISYIYPSLFITVLYTQRIDVRLYTFLISLL